MDPIQRIEKATEVCGQTVGGIKPDQLDSQTPCSEFKVRDLMNHLLGGLEMLRDAASGGKPAMPDGDSVGDGSKIGEEYAARRAKLLDVIKQPGTFDKNWEMPFGSLPGQMMAGIAFMEHLTHAWDLAKATGQNTELPSDLVSELNEVVRPMDAMLRMPGVCAAAVTPPEGATETQKIMAFLGREP